MKRLLSLSTFIAGVGILASSCSTVDQAPTSGSGPGGASIAKAPVRIEAGVLGIPAAICGSEMVVNLIRGQTQIVGNVTVSNDETNLYIMISSDDDEIITNSQVAVATTLAGIPQNKSGNPQPGQFPYTHSAMYQIPLPVAAGGELYIAVHAEGAWSEGLQFPGANWATYFIYTVQECVPSADPDAFRTQTQGGWGIQCHGGNPGCYRDEHFAQCFPGGLVIGCPDAGIRLDNSDDVENFLPQGGEPGALTAMHVNPTGSTEAGVLAGQVVALALNTMFDQCDPDFGESDELLVNLVVADPESPFYGWTVMRVYHEANMVLCATSQYSASAINECVSQINENYVDGEVDNGFIALP